MKYTNESEITALVETFENGTIAREKWHHAEHLVVAQYYLSRHDFETALAKMRDGIFNLLKAFKVDLSKENPYHETLTVFWMRTVDGFGKSNPEASLVEICNRLAAGFDKDYPLKFYSRELLFSETARERFIEADLVQPIKSELI